MVALGEAVSLEEVVALGEVVAPGEVVDPVCRMMGMQVARDALYQSATAFVQYAAV